MTDKTYLTTENTESAEKNKGEIVFYKLSTPVILRPDALVPPPSSLSQKAWPAATSLFIAGPRGKIGENNSCIYNFVCYTKLMFERCLYFNSNALVRKVNHIWKDAYNEVRLSPSHAYLLRLVLAQPGLSQIAIAEELNLDKSTITRFLNKLETEEYVKRTVAVNRSTREQNIYPTEKARQLHTQLEEIGDTLYTIMLAEIGDDDLRQLVNNLRDTATKL
ncbi:MAG: MarR family transcriptional regulator [Chloroflexota bacterium]